MWTALVPASLLHASVALALVAPAPQQPRLLNPPLPVEHLGDVQNAVIAPGGARVVYVEGSSGDLFSVPIDSSSAPIRLNSRVTGGDVDPLFRFDPQGTRVVYRAARVFRRSASSQVEGALDLFSAPIDGSAGAVLLSLADLGGAQSDFQVTPSGMDVLYRELGWLFSVPITGGHLVILSSRGTVEGVSGFRILADSSGIVYREDRTRGMSQLFRIPLAGSPNPVLLSGPTGRVEPDFELIPDGRFVVYRTDVGLDGTLDLVAAPTSAPFTPRQLSAGVVPGGDVNSFLVNPDNVRVIYAGEQEHAGIRELYCARLDGAVPPVRLNDVLKPGGDVRDGYRIDGFSLNVIFRASPGRNVCTLNSTRIDGAREVLVAPMKGRDSIADDFRISRDNSRVAFRADPDGDGVFDLYSVPSRNAAGLRLLARGVLDFELNHTYAFYRAEETPGVPELFAVPLDGSRAPVRVHPPLALGHATRAPYAVADDGRHALFVADPNVRGVFELFFVSGGRRGPLQLSGDEVRLASRPGSVQDFVLAGGRALYRAAQELDDVVGLYSVPLDGSAAPRVLSPASVTPSKVVTRALTADGARVCFVVDNEHARRELYAAPVDGSAPTVRLDAPAHARCDVEPRFVLTPDGRSALYVADQELDDTRELYRVALDGRSAPVRLHPPLREGRSVKATFQLTPDGTRVLFASDLGVAERFDLYVAPLDGSSAPRKLSQKANGGGDVREITLTPDGASAVYLADQAVDGQFELWRVPLDASEPPRRLNDVLIPEGDVGEYAVDPTGTWALYLADEQRDEQRGLYAVPLDGSAPPRELFPRSSPDSYAGVGRFVVTQDGTRVAFLGAVTPNYFALYVAPLDGSAPAKNLRSLGSYLPNWDLRLTPDGTRAVYRLQAPGSFYRDREGLFSVPLDGSRLPVVLSTVGMLAEPFAITADSSSVVYATRLIDELGFPIYRVPVDGPREASLGLAVGTLNEPTQLELDGQTTVWLQGDLYAF